MPNPNKMKNTIAIVLAGNGEHRIAEAHYGQPQELYTADVLSAMGLDTFITKITKGESECNYPQLSELYPEQGAIHAIISLLNDKEMDNALLVPCDMPLLDSELLQKLLDTYVEEDTIVCFRQHGTPFIEPFPAIFEKAVLELLVTDVVEGKISLQELLNHAGSHLIEIPKDDRMLNAADESTHAKILEILSISK